MKLSSRVCPAVGTMLPAALLLVFGLAGPASAQIDDEQFRRDLEAMTSHPTRVIGSEGYEATADYLREQIEALPGVQLREHTFTVMMPVTESAGMSMPDGSVEPIYPFWPAKVRVNATPEEDITGRPIYIRTGDFDEIPPSTLFGQIAVMEASAGERWKQAPYFGARAILVLGDAETNHIDLHHHDVQVPVNIPRFYIPPGELNDRLRRGEIEAEVTLRASVTWQPQTARNLYALVESPLLAEVNRLPTMARWAMGRSATPAPEGWPHSAPPGALMFSVPYDSSGLVPDLANGASQAVQAAAGLALLRDLSQQPLKRPVVVFFGGGDSVQFLATREMFMAFSDVPAMWREELGVLSEREARVSRDLARLRELLPDPTRIDTTRDRGLLERVARIIETDVSIDQQELFRLRIISRNLRSNQEQARIEELEARQIFLNRIRFAIQTQPSLLRGEVLEEAMPYLRRTEQRMVDMLDDDAYRRSKLEERIDLYRWLADRLHRDPDPSPRANNSRLIELLVAVDLSDRGVRVGPMFYGRFQRLSNIGNINDYRDWFRGRERDFRDGNPDAAWLGEVRQFLDLSPMEGRQAPQSWLAASMAVGSELCQAWGVPGFSMITLDDLRMRRDTPTDTLDRLDVDAILPQLHALRTTFWTAWNDMRFRGPVELRWQRSSFDGQVVSPAPGRPVPDLPREGFVATYYYAQPGRMPTPRNIPWTLGVRRDEVRPTNADGRYYFEGLPRTGGNDQNQLTVMVYRIEPGTGRITATSDLGQQAGDVRINVDVRQTISTIRSLVFECTEFSLVGLYDPRFLQDLGEVLPLDARRNAEPQRYNMLLTDQLLAGFVEPNTQAYLVFRYGRIGNRLLLLNMAESEPQVALGAALEDEAMEAARGFSVDALNRMEPIALVTARDFLLLDRLRLTEYRRAGVSSSLVDALHAQAWEQLERARLAYQEDRGRDMIAEASGAWANEARVYAAAQAMANDVIRAAIFLLLLCVPFSFCMERLLKASADIYRQIGWTFLIFAIMTAALWSFHPAFRISSSPLIIILAFAIIFMSIVVIAVVYSKFDTELKRIRSGRGSVETTSFARASVLMSAVLLGIANMRKRIFRTMLTAITIILITFAVLAFTSATRYLDTTTLPTGVETDHPGLMLRQRGFRPMPPIVLSHLRAVLGDEHRIVERWWNVNAGDPRDQIHIVATGPRADEAVASADDSAIGASLTREPPRIFAAQAVLGLSPGESGLSPLIAELIGREAFGRLEGGEERIVYFSTVVQNQLRVDVGDTVRVGGIDLEVAGIFDANEFDQRVRMLSGEPIAPLEYASGMLDAGGRELTEGGAEGLDLDPEATAAELAGAYEHLPSTQFVIVPSEVSRMLPNASLRSVALRLRDEAEVRALSDELSKRYAIAMFAGFDDGVRMVAASNLASVSGAGQVAIPLAIAGLIIFNTMMGSIAERRREIHVYTSLGLAPMHVGALFVAEAMTYGLIGTVFGYVIGQGVGTALLHLGWLGNVTLNYSGTSAMMTMGLILIIVLLSALVPARLASKIAAPSIERNWRVPLPQGDLIEAHLPFTINKTAADGALAYLAEFFDAHREGSIGKFSAGDVGVFTWEDDQGRSSRGLRTTVWLTPFDLGVRQHLMLLIHPGQFPDIYEVQVKLQRLSGDDGSWYRMNRTFLTELRKQFLQWRSLSPQRMLEFVEESRQLFSEAEKIEESEIPGTAGTAPGVAGA